MKITRQNTTCTNSCGKQYNDISHSQHNNEYESHYINQNKSTNWFINLIYFGITIVIYSIHLEIVLWIFLMTQYYMDDVSEASQYKDTPTWHGLFNVIHIKSNQIKSNQILFKVSNVHLKEKKISKKLFTWLYSIPNNNKLYIWFKYFGTLLWNRTWPSNENIFQWVLEQLHSCTHIAKTLWYLPFFFFFF